MILSYINVRLVRRVDYQETRAGQVATHFRFVYDNYLCVQRLNADNGNAVRTEFVWDPTEPIATRPLVMRAKNWDLNLFYTHDGNKNVSEVFYHALQNGIAAHYDYAPFGAPTAYTPSENPYNFSSEFYDESLNLSYYNYRHYISSEARWIGRDPQEEMERFGAYSFCNNAIAEFDYLGRVVPIVVSPIIPVNPPVCIDEFGNVVAQPSPSPSSDDVLECVHVTLDAAGIWEPTPICDALNALIYRLEGRYTEMSISLCGVIPYLGDIGKGGKYICKVVKKDAESCSKSIF